MIMNPSHTPFFSPKRAQHYQSARWLWFSLFSYKLKFLIHANGIFRLEFVLLRLFLFTLESQGVEMLLLHRPSADQKVQTVCFIYLFFFIILACAVIQLGSFSSTPHIFFMLSLFSFFFFYSFFFLSNDDKILKEHDRQLFCGVLVFCLFFLAFKPNETKKNVWFVFSYFLHVLHSTDSEFYTCTPEKRGEEQGRHDQIDNYRVGRPAFFFFFLVPLPNLQQWRRWRRWRRRPWRRLKAIATPSPTISCLTIYYLLRFRALFSF